MKKRILTCDNEADLAVLRRKSKEVEKVDASVTAIVTELLETMRAGDTPDRIGVGLAAPQIGYNLRIIVLEYAGHKRDDGTIENAFPTTVLINPKVTKFSRDKEVQDEGCFSVPHYYGPVERSKKLRLTALDVHGKKIQINASGYFARVLQHEIDHLDGVLYTDLVPKNKLYKYAKDKDSYEIEY